MRLRLRVLNAGVVFALLALACSTPPVPLESEAADAGPAPPQESLANPGPMNPVQSAEESPLPRVLAGQVSFEGEELERVLALSPPPEPPNDETNAYGTDPRAARLGQALFFDERLSATGAVSCATCHDPHQGFGDGKQVGEAIGKLERHSMTLWNVVYNRWFFWDGRTDSLWSQALVPLETPAEHGGSRLQFVHLLADDPDYRRAYEEIFGPLPELEDLARFPAEGRPVPEDPEHPHAVAWGSMAEPDRRAVNSAFANLGKAIGAYERKLVSRRSPFDVFVEGVREGNPTKQRALGDSARRGLKLYMGRGKCHVCHGGPLFTDFEFHNNRVRPLEGGSSMDPGRFKGVELVEENPFNGIGQYSDAPEGPAEAKVGYLRRSGHNWGEFKTPSLRNVAVTAPYMHQGQFASLREVLHHYSTLEDAIPTHHQAEQILQPLLLTERELDDLISFLESLTDIAIDSALFEPPPTPYLVER